MLIVFLATAPIISAAVAAYRCAKGKRRKRGANTDTEALIPDDHENFSQPHILSLLLRRCALSRKRSHSYDAALNQGRGETTLRPYTDEPLAYPDDPSPTPVEDRPPDYSHALGSRGQSLFDVEDPEVLVDITRNHLQQAPQVEQDSEVFGYLDTSNSTPMLQTGWLLRLTTLVHRRCCGRYNVVALRKGVDFHLAASGVIADFLVFYRGGGLRAVPVGASANSSSADEITYRVVAFREGVAVKRAGAGDVDWDWKGNTQRVGDKIVRFRPAKT